MMHTAMERNPEQTTGSEIRALVIEDDPGTREQMVQWLKQQQDVDVTALSFEESLSAVEREAYDLILIGRNTDRALRETLVEKARERNNRVVIAVIGNPGPASQPKGEA